LLYVAVGLGALLVIGIIVASKAGDTPRKKSSGVKVLGEDGRPKPPAPPPAPDPNDLAPRPSNTAPFTEPLVPPTPSPQTPAPSPQPQTSRSPSARSEEPAPARRYGVLTIKDGDGNTWELDYSAVADYVTLSLDRDSLNARPRDGKLSVSVIWQQRFDFHPVDCYLPGRSDVFTFNRAVDDHRFTVILDRPKGARISVVRDTNKM
jgi:hypothetical protein